MKLQTGDIVILKWKTDTDSYIAKSIDNRSFEIIQQITKATGENLRNHDIVTNVRKYFYIQTLTEVEKLELL